MKRYLLSAITAVLLLCSLAACLEPEKRPFHEGIDLPNRIDSQQRRIDAGISLGEFTREEAAIIQDNLNWIKQKYARAKDDGRISGEEWGRIEQYLDQNSKMIAEKKDNPVQRLFSLPYQPPQVISFQDKMPMPTRWRCPSKHTRCPIQAWATSALTPFPMTKT